MSTLYLDASALVKRYLTETGSNWVCRLIEPTTANYIAVAEITQVEVAAALAARHRAPGGITQRERDGAVDLLARHCQSEYCLVALIRSILDRAVDLTQNHRLRGYDAVQLAVDDDLLAAARSEGLATENPNYYP